MNILLADRILDSRRRVRRLLESLLAPLVVGEARTGAAAVRLAARKRPSVVVMGSTLRGPGCLETVRLLRAINPSMQVIVLTARHTKSFVRAARRSGASYCVPVRTMEIRLPSLIALAHRDFLEATARRRRGSRRSPVRRGGPAR